MKGFLFFKRMKFSNKWIVWLLGGVFFLALIYIFGIVPIIESTKKTKEEIILKRKALIKYDTYLQGRKMVEEELNLTLSKYEGIKKKLITAETPQLGAANLQEVVKRLAEKSGVGIRSFRILEPKERAFFKKISIQVDFNPTNSMLNLGQFLYDIEHYERELIISEMDLVVLNPRTPTNIQGSLVISGFIIDEQVKEKGGKE